MPKAPKSLKQTVLKTNRMTSTPQAAGASRFGSKRGATHSHLYTDDNPETTLHGTGFKDSDTARHTIKIVSKRSLAYQFQTINPMYHRAKGHPNKTPGIKAAMSIFGEWLTITYPNAKKSLRASAFKPVLSKEIMSAYASKCRAAISKDDLRFLDVYTRLPTNKRITNVLLNNSEPGGKDWEQERYDVLCRIVPEGKEEFSDFTLEELWDTESQPTDVHLRWIAWGWSPVPHRTLAGRAKALVL
ncbi:uncharacterized protein PV09_01889 [Verruconis gallopava]|uniref:Uncharacterized protein n=1 Tax=Verruconis gallopava TaxID=253628 RepID=A0A0D2ANB5_9PEZI|nr:uncharacterized protein PV09_01889 [Verruconis gallopava]KIW07990.1 hypothetical protein PV09_01889 [Verruconis gallopava]